MRNQNMFLSYEEREREERRAGERETEESGERETREIDRETIDNVVIWGNV